MTALLYLIQIYRVVDRCKGLRIQGSGLWQRLHHPPLRGAFPSRGRLCVEDSVVLVSQPSPLGKGDRAAVDRVLSLMAYLRRSPSLFFIPLSPSNLRPFGAPPSIGRREYPRKPLPLEGAAERSEAGLALFFWRRSRLLFAFPTQERLCFGDSGILVS